MMLPENLQHFHEPTLILIGDFGKTIIYKAQDIDIDELRSIKAPEPPQPETDSSVVVGPGVHAKTDTKPDDGEQRKQFSKELSQTITDLVDDHGIKDIQLIMPAELIRRLEEELTKDITDLISRTLDKNLTKINLVEALERLLEIPKQIK